MKFPAEKSRKVLLRNTMEQSSFPNAKSHSHISSGVCGFRCFIMCL